MTAPALPPLYHADAPTWASAWGEDEYGVYAEFEFKGVRQRMRWIAPGKFMMGSPENEAERWDDEVQHEVELTEGYWMADTVCTQALWQAVMGDNPSHFKVDDQGNPTPLRPVENVSWNDCQEFLRRINEAAAGLELRLPTEAQWEYACRAGTETPFAFGKYVTTDHVNYDGRYPYAGVLPGKYRQLTLAVGTLPPNPWGLFEMHGNVWEWCEDWFGEYSKEEAVDPAGPLDGTLRVLRGGSWFNFARSARSARRRHGARQSIPFRGIGFRFVRGR